ncbi:hypothetical protein DBP19_36215 [Streptomyces sp. CS090A]|uniref:endonuclease domain-containing protein n=1 Tax=Streptomyces sp. CS090A TaxID=2162710 RepID=UPI000D51416E|nr:endonuclease domain-containing protein [Streptomyces sp. CS090A]PVC80585.1 hypothetical protein DBP19_36215 [Streptomyces sp. CS090A]
MKKGGICGLWSLQTGWDTPEVRHWPACYNHLTAEERQEYVTFNKAREDADAQWWRAFAPACWGWPVATTFQEWRPSFEVGPGDHQYTQQSADDLLKLCESDPETRASTYLYEWQDGRCAICESGSDLVEDHDHATALVRGLLCRGCNTKEGMDRGSVGPYAKYRERNPASILGVTFRYWDAFLGDYAEPVVHVPQSRAENPWLKVQAKRREEST